MAGVAAQCVLKPGRVSLWSESLGRYVCRDSPEFEHAAARQDRATAQGNPPIGATFKLVFLTAAIGTVMFTALCIGTTLLAGRDPPPLLTEVVRALADLAKIGFGAIVGMLGGQALKR
jgi:hypothetical protein